MGADHARRDCRYGDDLGVVAAAPRLSTPARGEGSPRRQTVNASAGALLNGPASYLLRRRVEVFEGLGHAHAGAMTCGEAASPHAGA